MSEIRQNTEINADKIRKDILDLQDKKSTLKLSLQIDIDAIDSDMKKEFCKIGEDAYELYSNGDDSLSPLKEAFESLDQHKEARNAKEKKIVEITERYDEEIELLEKLLPNVDENVDENVEANVVGDVESNVEANVDSDVEANVEANVDSYVEAKTNENPGQAFCANCGTPYSPTEDLFCSSCGTKLQN